MLVNGIPTDMGNFDLYSLMEQVRKEVTLSFATPLHIVFSRVTLHHTVYIRPKLPFCKCTRYFWYAFGLLGDVIHRGVHQGSCS